MGETKPTNPKDAIGSDKLPMHLWPTTATIYGVLGLLDGALKYGRSNFRAMGVRSSIYYDAARRHLDAWFEGEDLDPDSGLPHLGHALACIAILVESIEEGNLTDDRMYPGGFRSCVNKFTEQVKRLKEKYKGGEVKHYTIADAPKCTIKVESDGFVKGLSMPGAKIVKASDVHMFGGEFQPFTVKGLIDTFAPNITEVQVGDQEVKSDFFKGGPEFAIWAVVAKDGHFKEYLVNTKTGGHFVLYIVTGVPKFSPGLGMAKATGLRYRNFFSPLEFQEALNGLSKMEKKPEA